jgi:polyisoprenoid-binding protein YceI
MSTITKPDITPGTWAFDPAHSEIGFSVRHLMVSKVKGRFGTFDGSISIAEQPLESSVNVSVDMSSIDTRDENRDAHLRSPDFFETDKYPTMTFVSTEVRPDGDGYVVVGDLSIHGVTKPIELAVEFNGVGSDPWGGKRLGFSAEGEVSRKEWGIDIDMPLESGGVVVGDKIKLQLEVEAVLQGE